MIEDFWQVRAVGRMDGWDASAVCRRGPTHIRLPTLPTTLAHSLAPPPKYGSLAQDFSHAVQNQAVRRFLADTFTSVGQPAGYTAKNPPTAVVKDDPSGIMMLINQGQEKVDKGGNPATGDSDDQGGEYEYVECLYRADHECLRTTHDWELYLEELYLDDERREGGVEEEEGEEEQEQRQDDGDL